MISRRYLVVENSRINFLIPNNLATFSHPYDPGKIRNIIPGKYGINDPGECEFRRPHKDDIRNPFEEHLIG